jgi:ribosomal protein S18 acetylase RimI-like enzyme
MEIRRVLAVDWEALRDTRLRALADAPDAFGTTFEEASVRPEEWWRTWALASAESETQAMYLAWEEVRPVGIAGVFNEAGVWFVISMWTDPQARGRGIGRALLDAVVAFARERGAVDIRLSVTDGNEPARRLYEGYGFADSGVSEPLRSNSSLTIRELKLA